jgi:hypothetical protein
MLWRQKGSAQKKKTDPSSGRQIWSRIPRPTEAMFGQFPQTLDLGDDPGKVRVYPDEIDPEWAGPATFDDPQAADGEDDASPPRASR